VLAITSLALAAAGAPASVQQDYLLQARQIQALSFAVHIPLVCFGIALPALRQSRPTGARHQLL